MPDNLSFFERREYAVATSGTFTKRLATLPARPRVLFVSTSKANGGADRHAVGLAASLQARGNEIVFAARRGRFIERLCRDAGIPTTHFNVGNSADIGAIGWLTALILKHRSQIVHVHARRDFVPATLAVAAARRLRGGNHRSDPRLLLHVHLLRTLGQPDRASGRFFETHADGVIAVSDSVADLLNERHGFPSGFVHRIFNGVDLERFSPPQSRDARERRRERRRGWGIPEQALVIGMVGRLHEKGQMALLRAIAEVVRTFPEVRVVLAGPEKWPGDVERFRERAAYLGLGRNVVVTGIEEDVPGAMAAFDILVHLPLDEAFGLVLIEAMASGLPVIATAVGGCCEVVQHGQNGLLVRPHAQDELVEAIQSLLNPETGPALRRRLGAEGRCRAACYSERKQLDQIQDLYQEMLRAETGAQ